MKISSKNHKDDLVIVRVDGGVVSQFIFFAIGELFKKKGFMVKYDLTWFENEAKGYYNPDKNYDKTYNLNFDIPKIFPNVSIEIASQKEINHYKKRYRVDDELSFSYAPPLYICGYNITNICDVVDISRQLRTQFVYPKSEANAGFLALLKKILNTQSCGVHIRRGDLSNISQVYGTPSGIEFFIRAIELVCALQKECQFFLFSDDKIWVERNLIPKLKSNNFILCDVSTVENPYLDLYLISKCKFIIGSHGSMGLGAKLLADETSLFISPRYYPYFRSFNNIFIVNFDAKPNDFRNKMGGGMEEN